MHIKQITISNFRSFRQQPEIQPFVAGTNTVVGRNGSGKSNLFDAVQFCLLAPRFANLRQVRPCRRKCTAALRRALLVDSSLGLSGRRPTMVAEDTFAHSLLFPFYLRTNRKNDKLFFMKVPVPLL
jgi:recombinational DNA repair ATPase RecF